MTRELRDTINSLSHDIIGVHGPVYFDREFLLKLVEHLERKSTLVNIGLDQFDAADVFASVILNRSFLDK